MGNQQTSNKNTNYSQPRAQQRILIDKNSIEQNMKKICQALLETYLLGKKYDESNVKQWGDDIIYFISGTLCEKYPQYGFGIFFYMSDKTSYVGNRQIVYYKETDIEFVIQHNTDDFFSEVRIFAMLRRAPQKDFSKNIFDSNLFLNINKKLDVFLRGRKFNFELFQDIIKNIVNDINDMLLARNNYPLSFHVGYINELPTKGVYIGYKIFRLGYYPIFFNYGNDSFLCRLFLFFIDIN